jgi:sulfonate transport system substrate-binding protein
MTLASENSVRPDTKSPALNELWYTRCPVPTASGLALELGWLAQEFRRSGIALSSLRESEDEDVRLAHFSHTLPGLFREGGNIPAIWARSRGQETAVVALTWVDEYQAILARPESGINTPADLRGARIGLPRQSGQRVDFARAMALRGVVSALNLGGLTTDDVTLVDIMSEQRAFAGERNRSFHNLETEALSSGRIDAIYVKGATGRSNARERRLLTVIDLGQHAEPLVRVNNGNPRPVTVDRRTALERPDLVARYLSVLIRVADWAKAHPVEVTAIVASEVDQSRDDVRAAYGPLLNLSFGLDLSPQRRAGLALQKDFLLHWGFIANDFDVNAWIDDIPLAMAKHLTLQPTAQQTN